MLSKLHVAATSDMEAVKSVLELLAECTETGVAGDATSRNTLSKLQNTLLKIIHDDAGAERGQDETVVGTTIAATPRNRRHTTREADSSEDESGDDATNQLQREMQASRIEESDEEDEADQEATLHAVKNVNTETSALSAYDTSQLPDEQEMQSLMDSLGVEDDSDIDGE